MAPWIIRSSVPYGAKDEGFEHQARHYVLKEYFSRAEIAMKQVFRKGTDKKGELINLFPKGVIYCNLYR